MGSVIGTAAYMSPEQAQGRWDLVGPTSDVYSLGPRLYCWLPGQEEFQGSEPFDVLAKVQKGHFLPPQQVNANVPGALEAICLKAMKLKPEDRYPSRRELTEYIEHWLADESVAAWLEPWSERVGRWIRRHRTIVSTGFAGVGIATISLTIATVLLTAANERERDATTTAEQKREEADQARQRAETAEAEALIQKNQAETNAAEAKKQEKEAKDQPELSP